MSADPTRPVSADPLLDPRLAVTQSEAQENAGRVEVDVDALLALLVPQPPDAGEGLDVDWLNAKRLTLEKAVELRRNTERTAISNEDWRYLNGYESALIDLGILSRPHRAALTPKPEEPAR